METALSLATNSLSESEATTDVSREAGNGDMWMKAEAG